MALAPQEMQALGRQILSVCPVQSEHANHPRSQITKGALLSYLSLLIANASGLLVTPYMLRALGTSEYGLYTFIGAAVAYVNLLDFGLTNSIVRYVARYRATGDHAGEASFLHMAMIAYVGIAALVAAVGLAVYPHVALLLGHSLSAGELRIARLMFAVLIANVAISLPSGAFAAIITGYEHFAFAKGITVVKLVIRTLLLVGLLCLGFKALAIVVLDTAMNAGLFLAHVLYVRFHLRVRFISHRFDKALAYEVGRYSLWLSASMVFSQLYPRVGQIALGILDGTRCVAVFGVGALLGSYYASLGYVISSLLLPHAARVVATGASPSALTSLMIRVGRMQFVILSYALGGFMVVGRQFITLWAGAAYRDSWIVGALIMSSWTIAITRDFGVSIQQAQNRTVFRSFYCAYLVLGVGSLGIISRRWFSGPVAMAFGDMVTVLVGHVIMTAYYSRIIKIHMVRFHREVFLPQLYCALAATIIGAVAATFLRISSWPTVLCAACVYSLAFAALTWGYGLKDEERGLLASLVVSGAERLGLSVRVAERN